VLAVFARIPALSRMILIVVVVVFLIGLMGGGPVRTGLVWIRVAGILRRRFGGRRTLVRSRILFVVHVVPLP
jgi:hypothetical protein